MKNGEMKCLWNILCWKLMNDFYTGLAVLTHNRRTKSSYFTGVEHWILVFSPAYVMKLKWKKKGMK